MKIVHILPEMKLGGVERHVIDLANAQVELGHDVTVISGGGQMESQFDAKVKCLHMPVYRKELFTIISCGYKIGALAAKEKVDIIHAHSRVPGWIAYIASSRSKIPYIMTAHSVFGTKTRWIYKPFRKADKVICVSPAVEEGMADRFTDNTVVIVNGLDKPKEVWKQENRNKGKLLFVGRLTDIKGVQDLIPFLPKDLDWSFEIVGEGPKMAEWKELAAKEPYADKIKFCGYSDQVDEYMANASCLLFPSHSEGLGLTLARAVQIGLPVLASDIPPVADLAGTHKGLLPPGDGQAWGAAIREFLLTGKAPVEFPQKNIRTLEEMVMKVIEIYEECINHRKKI